MLYHPEDDTAQPTIPGELTEDGSPVTITITVDDLARRVEAACERAADRGGRDHLGHRAAARLLVDLARDPDYYKRPAVTS